MVWRLIRELVVLVPGSPLGWNWAEKRGYSRTFAGLRFQRHAVLLIRQAYGLMNCRLGSHLASSGKRFFPFSVISIAPICLKIFTLSVTFRRAYLSQNRRLVSTSEAVQGSSNYQQSKNYRYEWKEVSPPIYSNEP